jgi:hypothetical protein
MNLSWDGMPIHQAIKADWKTPELLIEGSLGCAKTTVWLDKEIDALLKWPGIPILLFRWTEDAVSTKLKPAFEELLSIRGVTASWEAKEKYYQLDNGSRAFMFGLKAVSEIEMFNKIRGLGVARASGDQVEEMRRAVAGELRGRLRPNLTATLTGQRYPFQLTFVANPSDTEFWLSREFPVDNRIKGRKVFSLSVFDNPHLPQETIENLLRTYPPEHPKHQTLILGQRGMNIVGDAVYEHLYDRTLHARSIPTRDAPLLEAFETGKHNPVWIVAQRQHHGGMLCLGGIIGRRMVLEDFLPIVKEKRAEWFPGKEFQTCTNPMGDKRSQHAARYTALAILRKAGVQAAWRDNANAPDVRLAMIEDIAGYLRRRTLGREEAFGINNAPERWLEISADGITPKPFLGFAFEGGYTWSEHFVSISNKEVRKPVEDDYYANAMHCLENIELNFCAGRKTGGEHDAQQRTQIETDSGNGFYLPQGPNAWMAH